MRRCYIFLVFIMLYNNIIVSQIAINLTGNNPHNSAALDIDFDNKGLLIPRISLTSVLDNTTISSPAVGL